MDFPFPPLELTDMTEDRTAKRGVEGVKGEREGGIGGIQSPYPNI